jgi:hypothetical protein
MRDDPSSALSKARKANLPLAFPFVLESTEWTALEPELLLVVDFARFGKRFHVGQEPALIARVQGFEVLLRRHGAVGAHGELDRKYTTDMNQVLAARASHKFTFN